VRFSFRRDTQAANGGRL